MTESHRAPNAWIAPAARDLPDLRARMVEWTGTNVSLAGLSQSINQGKIAMMPTVPGLTATSPEMLERGHYTPGAIAAPILAKLEQHRLNEATLFYATADMTSLAVAAGQVPPTEPFTARRLPAQSGLIVFEEPIGGYTIKVNDAVADWDRARPDLTVTTPIVGASWSRWTPDMLTIGGGPGGARVEWYTNQPGSGMLRVPFDFDGVWITFYSAAFAKFGEIDPDEPISTHQDGSVMTAGEIAAMKEPYQVPELSWDNESCIAWGTDLNHPPHPDTTDDWVHVLYTAWQLMTQTGGKHPITETEEVQPPRARRRRDERAGITGPSGVNVVRVHTAHRPPAEAADEDAALSTGRRAPNWSCRWPVRPHRRYVCLNPRKHQEGECEHEDKIIPFHIKGPSDKPLRVPETVHLWDSQPPTGAS